jgi:DNA-binding LacI/PurR family transcriptional regulator
MVFVSPEATDASSSHTHYRRLRADGVRMVFVNGGIPGLDVPDIFVDEQVAGYLATRHLVDLGHVRIGFVCGPARSVPTRLKLAGWHTAMEEAGLPAPTDLVAHVQYGANGGVVGAGWLLDRAAPSALVCASDVMALGAMSEARRRGLSVPDDLSIVGFDDTPMAAYAAPPLTTLTQPIAAMAREAIDGLVAELEETDGPVAHSRVFRPRLTVRGTTAPPPMGTVGSRTRAGHSGP